MITRVESILIYVFILCISTYPCLSVGQTVVEPYVGYSIDLNNRETLTQVQPGVQVALVHKPFYKLLVSLQAGFPANAHKGADNAYASNPALPLQSLTERKTSARSFGLSLGNRFRVAQWRKRNALSALVSFGLAEHQINVRYLDRNSGYTILNPHRNYERVGMFFGIGTQYDRQMGKGRLFTQLTVSSPLFVKWDKYHYKTMAPLAINVGYGFDIKKRK